MPESLELKLDTRYSELELARILEKNAPWGHRVDFSNGLSTKDFEKRTPFTHNTLQKIKIVEKAIPFEQYKGGRVLDIGCNSGHNSIYLSTTYNMRATGIDVLPRHIEVSTLLSKVANLDNEYLLENAETYLNKDAFDIVLHFGTLYHLRNPLLSLSSTYENLKKGGYLALETQVYDHPSDENICYFMYLQNNDKTNFWALSTTVLKKNLELIGFSDIQVLLKVSPKFLEEHMSRIVLVARK